MSVLTRVKTLAVVAAVALLSSSCYFVDAITAQNDGSAVPWFCNPTAANSVTGPGMGNVDWYAGITRAPLDYDSCNTLGAQLDRAKAYSDQFPTLADAEAAGFTNTFNRINGMGTHHGLDALTPADLADPNFDRFNPIIPNSVIDDVFEPNRPEYMQYDGDGPSAVLVGMSYYVRTDDGQPPEGFVGDNDWWHHHPTLCLSLDTATVMGVNSTDANCNPVLNNSLNVHFDDYYMLHVWIVDDMEFEADIHSAFHPCILTAGAIFDMDDDCHDGNPLVIPSGGAPVGGNGAPQPQAIFCPLGQLVMPDAPGDS
jgi:hypothetical protein